MKVKNKNDVAPVKEVTITAKLQLILSDADKANLDETMSKYRQACNCVSDYIWVTHDLEQRTLNNALYSVLRNTFGLRSQMAQSVIKTVIARYKTVLKTQEEWLYVNFKRPQYDLVWNRDYSLNGEDNTFSVNTLNGRIKLNFHIEGFEKYFLINSKFGTAKLVNKHGKYFLYIPFTFDINGLSEFDVSNVVGIDRGIRFSAVTYNSKGKTKFYSGKEIKEKRAHYKNLRKELQQVGTPSSRRRLKAIGQRENRWVQDVNHCISKALVENNPKGTLFVIEDLTGIRAVTELVWKKHRYVQVSWPYYDLEQKLEYKALIHDQKVIKVNPKNTSRTCPKCGHTEKANRKQNEHRFQCKNCGYKSNDDRVAAMNLHRKGIEYLAEIGD